MKYERLPFVCYHCGRLDHEMRTCKEMRQGKQKGNMYGGWLKAEDQSIYKPLWKDEAVERIHIVSPPAFTQISSENIVGNNETVRSAVIELGQATPFFEPSGISTFSVPNPKSLTVTSYGDSGLKLEGETQNVTVEEVFELASMDIEMCTRALQDLLSSTRPTIVGLLETKITVKE